MFFWFEGRARLEEIDNGGCIFGLKIPCKLLVVSVIDDEVDIMVDVGGNVAANVIDKALLPEDCLKSVLEASFEELADFIRQLGRAI